MTRISGSAFERWTGRTTRAFVSWRFDRLSNTNPHQAGSTRAVLFDVLKRRDVVLSPRQLRKILAGLAIGQGKASVTRYVESDSDGGMTDANPSNW